MQASLRVVSGVIAVAVGAAIAMTNSAPQAGSPARQSLHAEMDDGYGTSRADLERQERDLEARLIANPDAGEVAAQLATVLLRRTRVEANGGYTAKAERIVTAVLDRQPDDYNALRALGAIRLSQHRFRQAIEVADRAMRIRPRDAWNFGVLGDAHLELGDYDQAFDAFDAMARLRPDASAYARIAYAQELQGRLPEALRAMTMATEATSARDPESLAWHHAQLGLLLSQMGRFNDAELEFTHADFVFPAHPYARLGRARLAVVRGDQVEGLRLYRSILSDSPTADVALAAGELLLSLGQAGDADAMFARAEVLEKEGWRTELEQPANLARILAARGARLPEAVALAENASQSRSDIFTMDALAWSYFRAGRLADAHAASQRARRTGTRDARILAHAAAIDEAVGE